MEESYEEPVDHGDLIASAADANDLALAISTIRSADFIVFQQIDPENGEIEEDEDGNFAVMLAAVDEDTAVVCFSNEEAAANFYAAEIADDLPEGQDLPTVLLPGEVLLDGLPSECGLLINPGAESECYFPPGCFDEPE